MDKVELACPRCGELQFLEADARDPRDPEYSLDVCDSCAEELADEGELH